MVVGWFNIYAGHMLDISILGLEGSKFWAEMEGMEESNIDFYFMMNVHRRANG